MQGPPDQNTVELYRLQVLTVEDYAMFFIDVEGVIRTWNPGVQLLLGYSEAEWVGAHTSLIFTPADKAVELFTAEIDVARQQGRASDVRWHRRKDGSELFANGVINAVRDSSGVLIGFTKVLSDETARKKLEDSLMASNSALEHFAYAASHDLQEPLRTIGSYSQLLTRKHRHELSETATEYLDYITNAIEKMDTLIRDLLAYARAGIETEALTISLDQDVESAMSQLAAAIEETGASVTHDPLPTVKAERTQMTRLFQNLIGNAIKYRSPDRAPKIHISASREGNEWIICVQDNGVGFAQQHADTIFNAFVRLHGRDLSGSGVGLTICRRIVERYGGRIWAESRIGEGSRFCFTSPPVADK
jgi:PAS domain S-box-containing protein